MVLHLRPEVAIFAFVILGEVKPLTKLTDE